MDSEASTLDDQSNTDRRQYDVFLSHAGYGAQKQGVVSQVFDELRKRNKNIRVFLDKDEMSLEYGDVAAPKMVWAAATAKVVVIFLSPDYLCRVWTLKELEIALARGSVSSGSPREENARKYRGGRSFESFLKEKFSEEELILLKDIESEGGTAGEVLPLYFQMDPGDCRHLNKFMKKHNKVEKQFAEWALDHEQYPVRWSAALTELSKITGPMYQERSESYQDFAEKVVDIILKLINQEDTDSQRTLEDEKGDRITTAAQADQSDRTNAATQGDQNTARHSILSRSLGGRGNGSLLRSPASSGQHVADVGSYDRTSHTSMAAQGLGIGLGIGYYMGQSPSQNSQGYRGQNDIPDDYHLLAHYGDSIKLPTNNIWNTTLIIKSFGDQLAGVRIEHHSFAINAIAAETHKVRPGEVARITRSWFGVPINVTNDFRYPYIPDTHFPVLVKTERQNHIPDVYRLLAHYGDSIQLPTNNFGNTTLIIKSFGDQSAGVRIEHQSLGIGIAAETHKVRPGEVARITHSWFGVPINVTNDFRYPYMPDKHFLVLVRVESREQTEPTCTTA